MRVLSYTVALLLFVSTARASTCPVIEGGSPELAQADATDRLDFIRMRLLDDGRNVLHWRAGWAIIYSAAIVGQLVAAPLVSAGSSRNGLFVGAASATLGVGTALLTPLHSRADGRALDVRLSEKEPENLCAALADAEQLLLHDAKDEHFERGVLTHVGNVLFNIGLGALLGFGIHNWTSAEISVPVGIAVGETMILSSPRGAADALAAYRSGQLVEPSVKVRAEGLSLKVSF